MLVRRISPNARLEGGVLTVAGIDPSTTETGFVILQGSGHKPKVQCEHRIRYPKLQRFDKFEAMSDEVMLYLNAWKPDVIVIEGYGLSFKHKSSVVPLIEFGGILRRRICRTFNRYLAPRPTSLKEFVTGSGSAKKPAIKAAIVKNYGHTPLSEDTADAYGCALMGLAFKGMLHPCTARQIEIVGSLSWE